MSKAVIIGANSYIARNLYVVMEKTKPDCDIILYDYAPTHLDNAEPYTSIRILEEKSVAKIDFDCDVVFDFVGKTGSINGFEDSDTFININEKALLNILNEYKRQNSKAKLIFPSTRLVYKGKEKPLPEDAEKEFKTIYAINKFACEQYLEQYRNLYNIKYCIFRICVPYGTLIPGVMSYGTAEFMIKKAKNGENITLYGDGEVRRTITHIYDVCANMIEGAFSDLCVNDIYNIGGEDYSLNEMAKLIASKYGVKVEHVNYPAEAEKIESGSTVFDASKLEKLGIKAVHKYKDWIKSEVI